MMRYICLFIVLVVFAPYSWATAQDRVGQGTQEEILIYECEQFEDIFLDGDLEDLNFDDINLDEIKIVEAPPTFSDKARIIFAYLKVQSEKAQKHLAINIHDLNEGMKESLENLNRHIKENERAYLIGGICLGVAATGLVIYYYKPQFLFGGSVGSTAL